MSHAFLPDFLIPERATIFFLLVGFVLLIVVRRWFKVRESGAFRFSFSGANQSVRGAQSVGRRRLNAVGFALLLAVSSHFMAQAEPSVTRIEFTIDAPDLPADSLGAKPKIMYLAGEKYARIEQPAEITSDVKNLIIVREPDIWLIDGIHKKGHHSVNAAVPEVHNPILGPDGPEALAGLEYGHELEFLHRAKNSLGLKGSRVNEQHVLEIQYEDYKLTLYTDETRNVPVKLIVVRGSKRAFTINYTTYRQDLPFDLALFQPPKDVTVDEVQN